MEKRDKTWRWPTPDLDTKVACLLLRLYFFRGFAYLSSAASASHYSRTSAGHARSNSIESQLPQASKRSFQREPEGPKAQLTQSQPPAGRHQHSSSRLFRCTCIERFTTRISYLNFFQKFSLLLLLLLVLRLPLAARCLLRRRLRRTAQTPCL